jgi:hypothetical protein
VRYREEKTHGGDHKSSGQNVHLIEDDGKTAERIADEAGVGEEAVRRFTDSKVQVPPQGG